jgi:broad specificity phosphatase PhoE
MMKLVYFITHPNVVIDPRIPVPQWPLSERGSERMRLMLKQSWVTEITSIYCSTEQKAIDGATILAEHLSLPVNRIADLGENDRSATGFLSAQEFEAVADQFFANPSQSIRGWETAAAAQRRIITAVDNIIAQDAKTGTIAIIAHGAVGTLLLCELAGYSIARKYDQPGSGGGNYYAFEAESKKLLHGWKAIEDSGNNS